MIIPRTQLLTITLFFFSYLLIPYVAGAQGSQILSVTPPLFQLSIAPGDIWQSTIRVVNGNPYELTVYTEVVNFAAEGERGQGKFIPIFRDDTTSTLAEWIEIAPGPHLINPEQSKEISFFVEVPEDAPPGGHFAAILIGTQPQSGSEERLLVQTSQTVTSLFFVRIEGDVLEAGDIREFSMKDSFIEEPAANFILRFENKGNVHLQPRGDIIITNMWGSERGVIPINQGTHFGNVLPESIREFNFSWKGERSITELGRYKAVVTLAYGKDGIKSTSAVTYFWVIPLKATLITLGGVAGFILFVIWAIRLYVRRVLALAGVDLHTQKEATVPRIAYREKDRKLTPYQKISAPIRIGAHDLKRRMLHAKEAIDVIVTLFGFIRSYKVFFGSVLIIGIGFVVGVLYIAEASKEHRNFEVTIEKEDGEVTVNSEEIIKERLNDRNDVDINPDQRFDLILVNESGEPGAAANLSLLLEEEGYSVTSLTVGEHTDRKETLILYSPGLASEAEALGSTLGTQQIIQNNSLSVPSDTERPAITVFIEEDVLK